MEASFSPAQVLEKLGGQNIGNLLPSMHMEKCGLSRQEAELEFLKVCNIQPDICTCTYIAAGISQSGCAHTYILFFLFQEAQKLPEYGMLFYRVAKVR